MPGVDDCGMLTGLLEGVQAARDELERTWGAGRLEKLAALEAVELLARFRRQQASWSVAYGAAWDAPILTRDLLATAQAKALSMQRGWAALGAWAAEAGHRPIAPWVWEVMLANGTVAAFVQSDEEAAKVIADGRYLSVYTVRELGHVLDALPNALQLAKEAWPGAKYQASRKVEVGNPLGAPEWSEAGDEIPF